MDYKAIEAELKAAWIAALGEATLPDETQWHRWRFDFGAQSVRHAINIAARKNFNSTSDTRLTPLSLWKITTSAAKSHSAALGYTKPWNDLRPQQPQPQQQRYTSEPLPMGYIPKKRKQSDTFTAPPEWLEADEVERYVPAEWE